MKTALKRLARRCIYTSNTVRYRVELPRLLEALRIVGKVDRAVDIGAAGGYYVVNAYLHFANRVHAIEYDTYLCDLLRQELAQFPERCTWQQGSILSLPVESAGADLVACTQVLEHIGDELRALAAFEAKIFSRRKAQATTVRNLQEVKEVSLHRSQISKDL